MTKKINVTMSEELLNRLEMYCDENYLSKSGVITMSLTDYLNAREFQSCIKNLSLAMKKVSESGKIDKETQNIMNEFETALKVLGFAK